MLPYYLLPIPLGLLAVTIYTVWDWQRHRAPIVAENPENHYTLLHHLKVVTLPVFRYRISFVVSRSDESEVRQLATKFPVSAAATTKLISNTQQRTETPPKPGVAASASSTSLAASQPTPVTTKPASAPVPTYNYKKAS